MHDKGKIFPKNYFPVEQETQASTNLKLASLQRGTKHTQKQTNKK